MFGGLMGMFDNDPFFADVHSMQQRQMQQMQAMMRDPFGGMMQGPHQLSLTGGTERGAERTRDVQHGGDRRQRQQVARREPDMFGGMSMFGNMQSMMNNMMAGFGNMHGQMMQDPSRHNGHMFTQSSYMSYSNDGSGAPKVYQATSSTRQAPGGIKETRKTVRDSESGMQKMAVGHHIGERAHVIKRSRNTRTDEREESQDLVNLDEEDTGKFDEEWKQKTSNFGHRSRHAIGHGESRRYNQREYTPSPMEGARPVRAQRSTEQDMHVRGRAAKRDKKVKLRD